MQLYFAGDVPHSLTQIRILDIANAVFPRFVAEREDFEVKVVGFDEKRDIRVRTVLAGRLDNDDN